ncbi:unnamed protein product [Phyllotreta striolata]|uniref:ubiquitinyl hydrolase 1 n=1 Tax=Phyllotreta striolata TaxID=444603 RepID=A0A9N9XK29_PHYSR|nr:unnamed protein product [Phyllotreta striolata]
MKDLYLTDSVRKLDVLAKKDDVISKLKKSHKFTHFANLIMTQLLECMDDQEKCYILCKRYINLMDYLFEISDDKIYTQSLHLSDYRKVKLLVDELKESLEKRYQALFREPVPQSPTNAVPPATKMEIGDAQIFKDKFIIPRDLFHILQKEQNFLLVDIRSQADFNNCRISSKHGTIINIPGDLIVPGLSANTLGQRLDNSLKSIWEKRDQFDIIILMDSDTQKYNFVGSKIERLRSFIVEWDTLRSYKQEPVVLNGGLREYVEWYPSSVDNSQAFLNQTNLEIDELLDLDSIIYPESGSTKQMNLKLHDLNTVNIETRTKNDLELVEDTNGNYKFESEGNLPQDSLISKVDPSSDQTVSKIPEPDASFPPLFEGEQLPQQKPEVPDVDMNLDIKKILKGDKAALLNEARKTKPRYDIGEPQEKGDKRRERPEDTKGSSPREKEPRLKEPSYPDRFVFSKPAPPTIDRSFKPVPLIGEGFTGLRNVKNICYMNGLLQCLKVIPILKSLYVTTERYISYTTRTPPKLNFHFAQVLRELWGGTYQKPKVFLIQEFKDRICEFAPMYDRNTHEDCFEFFMFLFNALSEDCAVDLPRLKMMTESEKAWYGHLQGRTSFLVDNFYYQLKNTKFCCNCKKVNLSFETDSTLMLPVATRTSHLRDMIAEYLRESRLTDFSCSNCKSTGTIINKKDLVVEPEVLVIVLKRYIANSDGTFRKNEVEVGFPLYDLQFGKYRYNLYGVVQHSGGMQFGHYYASALLNDKKGTWVLFNDESISIHPSPVNELPQIKSGAAGFFYVRNK